MPFGIILILVAAIGFYAFKKLRQELVRLDEEDAKRAKLAKTQKRADRQDKSNTLKRDPKTGVYRLDDD
ncbi:MAG: hypothetical protein ABJK39_10235 [Hyphomicrobiales bacterium]